MFAARLIPTNVLLYTCWAPLPILVEVENGAQASHRISHRGAILQLMQAQMYSAIFIASRLGTFMSGEIKKKRVPASRTVTWTGSLQLHAATAKLPAQAHPHSCWTQELRSNMHQKYLP